MLSSNQKIDWYNGDLSSLRHDATEGDTKPQGKNTKSSPSQSGNNDKKLEASSDSKQVRNNLGNAPATKTKNKGSEGQRPSAVADRPLAPQKKCSVKYSKEPPSPKGFGNDVPAFMLIDTRS